MRGQLDKYLACLMLSRFFFLSAESGPVCTRNGKRCVTQARCDNTSHDCVCPAGHKGDGTIECIRDSEDFVECVEVCINVCVCVAQCTWPHHGVSFHFTNLLLFQSLFHTLNIQVSFQSSGRQFFTVCVCVHYLSADLSDQELCLSLSDPHVRTFGGAAATLAFPCRHRLTRFTTPNTAGNPGSAVCAFEVIVSVLRL